jgi:hypothetical protein
MIPLTPGMRVRDVVAAAVPGSESKTYSAFAVREDSPGLELLDPAQDAAALAGGPPLVIHPDRPDLVPIVVLEPTGGYFSIGVVFKMEMPLLLTLDGKNTGLLKQITDFYRQPLSELFVLRRDKGMLHTFCAGECTRDAIESVCVIKSRTGGR